MASVAWAAKGAAVDRRPDDVSVEIVTVPAHEILDVQLESVQPKAEFEAPDEPALVELGRSTKPKSRLPRTTVDAPAPAPAPVPAPRRPRPLSPGEFGRETD